MRADSLKLDAAIINIPRIYMTAAGILNSHKYSFVTALKGC
jgi:hypothetical protein